jgi:TRAP-type C4-dicarboxylate transport system permease small subunit
MAAPNARDPEPAHLEQAPDTASTEGAGGLAGKLMRLNMAWCELLVLAMMLVVAIDVFMRAAFQFSLQVSEEIAGYLLVALVFSSLSIVAKEGALLRVDFLFLLLSERTRRTLDRIYALLGLGFVAIWTYQLGRLVWSSYNREMVSNTVLATPLWVPQVIMPVGGAFLLAVLVAIAWGRLRLSASSEGGS